MNRPLTRCLPILALGALLLGLGLALPSPPADPREGDDTDAVEAGAGLLRKERGLRPVRASLSMPYFSFAQSLRPRG